MTTLTERVNPRAAAFIAGGGFTLQHLTNIRDYGTKRRAKEEHAKIMAYVQQMIDDNCENIVEYNHSKARIDGRKYGKFCIQSVIREIRGALCEGLVTDIDQVNSHPNILLQICKKHDIDCVYLKTYCEEREKRLEQMMCDDELTRDRAKTLILERTNSTFPLKNHIKGKFITEYSKEMKLIQKAVYELKEYKHLHKLIKNDNNFLGAFMSLVLQVEEDIILTAMYDYLTGEEYSIHSLMFDGLMVYGDYYDDDDLLLEIEEHISKTTNYHMKLAYKTHDSCIIIPEDYITEEGIYQQQKEEFEKNNAKVDDKFAFVNYCGDVIIKTKENFLTLHMEKGKFLTTWLADPDKRSFQKFDTFPDEQNCPPEVYNLWKPFDAVSHVYGETTQETLDAGLQYFQNHQRHLVNNIEDHYNFAILWASQAVQYPQNKSVEIVYIGKQGTGKGLYVEFLTNIIGSEKIFQTANPQRDIYGQFNGGMKSAYIVVQNEANKSNAFGKLDMKKDLITDPTISINIKHGASFTMKSFHRFLTFTNHQDPVHTSSDDRRTVIFKGSDEVGDTDYFNKGWEFAANPDVCKYIFDWLMNYQSQPKINKCDFPINEYQNSLIKFNKPIMEMWFAEFVHSFPTIDDNTAAGDTILHHNTGNVDIDYQYSNGVYCVPFDCLWKDFNEFSKAGKYANGFTTAQSFSKELKLKLGLEPISKRMKESGVKKCRYININDACEKYLLD
jgi:hypothetical protein